MGTLNRWTSLFVNIRVSLFVNIRVSQKLVVLRSSPDHLSKSGLREYSDISSTVGLHVCGLWTDSDLLREGSTKWVQEHPITKDNRSPETGTDEPEEVSQRTHRSTVLLISSFSTVTLSIFKEDNRSEPMVWSVKVLFDHRSVQSE